MWKSLQSGGLITVGLKKGGLSLRLTDLFNLTGQLDPIN